MRTKLNHSLVLNTSSLTRWRYLATIQCGYIPFGIRREVHLYEALTLNTEFSRVFSFKIIEYLFII